MKNKPNVIMLVCDGLTYNMLKNCPSHMSPMRFTTSLKNNTLWCTEAYSQGPYTEAALKGTIYGKSPLEDGGYYVEQIGWDDSIFKFFKKNGYDLFTHYYASCIPPETLKFGDYSYCTKFANPMYGSYIRSKLDYYRLIWQKNELNINDYFIIFRLLERHFESIFTLYSNEYTGHDYTAEYTPFDNYDRSYLSRVKNGIEKFELEYKKFSINKKEYVNYIFENYDTCFLLNESNWNAANFKKTICDQKKWLISNYYDFIKEIDKKNTDYFLKNNLPSRKNTINNFKKIFNKNHSRDGLEFFARQFQCAFQKDKKIVFKTNLQQICNSAGALVNQFIGWHQGRKSNNPYFAYFHFDEFHRPTKFISHESLDYNSISEEMIKAKNYVDSLNYNYKGDIHFDLAAQYLDTSIENIFSFIKNQNELENTIFIITADHGSSNCGETARFTSTNNFFKEQYHIPLIIYGVKPKIINDFVQSKDIPPTLAKICGFNKEKRWRGIPIGENKREYVTVEYAGSGVPDLSRRPVLFGYRDSTKSYVVSGMISSKPDIDKMQILEFYNLIDDPNEIENIVNKLSDNQKYIYKKFFENRLVELYDNNKNYLNKLIK